MEEEVIALLLTLEKRREEDNVRIQNMACFRDNEGPFLFKEKIFRKFFRFPKTLCLDLIQELKPHDEQKSGIPFELRFISVLYFLANGSYQTAVANSYFSAMSQASVSRNIIYICKLIVKQKGKEISFPNTIEQYNAVKMSKEQLVEAIIKKRACNARAQSIVESLLERYVDENEFLLKLRDINQCHYDDVVDERYILHFCAYPLCGVIVESVPNKQYEISTLNNKVYDITERKKFCSKQCFKASQYIKSQMLTSPLWLRHHETIPQFKLLKVTDANTIPEFQSLNIS